MCGICGKVNFSGATVEQDLISRMCETIIHRGPDDEGIYVAPGIGLGERRLSIIDLRRSATAPLSNEDGSVWVVFNGEIYNFSELRDELLEKGHQFETATDTEVIVHLYEERGVECLERLRGMFAFALWDARRRVLFAARDRLGKKPFCYTRTPRGFIFASEIKAITADPEVSVSPNYNAIADYLKYQYVPSPATAFEGIFRLPAAHYLVCGADGTVTVERYWRRPLAEQSKATPQEIEEELLERLREAVRMRMIADVPLGGFLSGGVDSGAVVALMAQESSEPVKTFSIGFDDATHNELPYARLVAKRYHTEHHEFVVKPNAAEVLPLLVRHYNEPFADSSAVPTYYVSKVARQHVTVALSGDGGDENFCGYENYAIVERWAKVDRVPRLLRQAGTGLLFRVLQQFPYQNTAARLERGLNWLASDPPGRFHLQSSIFKPEEIRALLTPQFRVLSGAQRVAEDEDEDCPWNESVDLRDWMMRHDQQHYLPDCLMVKTDIASMANSLEVRCPLLDQRFVEFCSTIPSELKRDAHGGKRIFKTALRSLLPPETLVKRKMGFGVPLAQWLRRDLADLMRETLLDSRAVNRRLFEQSFVAKMLEDQATNKRDWSTRLWALLFLELWFREFID